MKILTILPVSRLEFFDRVIESLINQTYKEKPALLVVVDGNNELFLTVHNKLASVPLNYVLCVKSHNYGDAPAATIPQRRARIAGVHNQMKELIDPDVDWVFSIEDDGILPPLALQTLVNDVKEQEAVGLVTGVELGRWGVPYVGAWRVDDIMNVQRLTSMESKVGKHWIEELDACGLYCSLIRADLYKQHVFTATNGLGPDINMGLEFRQLGYKNYINWSIPVTHLTMKNLVEKQIPAESESMVINLTPMGKSQSWHAGP